MALSAQPRDRPHHVVAVGASAGGVQALRDMVIGLPSDFPHAVVVALHMSPGAPSVLARILGRSCPLPVEAASDGQVLQRGRIYVAVPDHHLLVVDDALSVTQDAREHGHRPSINVLFRSVASAYGPRAIGVLLSGVLDDGVLGAAAIRRSGGTTVAQRPSDALFPAMPLNALEAGVVDHQSTAAELGRLLTHLTESDRANAG